LFGGFGDIKNLSETVSLMEETLLFDAEAEEIGKGDG